MFGFLKKKQEVRVNENVYTVLNKELERMHSLLRNEFGRSSDANNVNIWWKNIQSLQEALLEALEKQPTHEHHIKDLQDTVAEILLLTNTDSK